METIFCQLCGTKIPKNSIFCPSCGAKQQIIVTEDNIVSDSKIKSVDSVKKPFYKKWWFITLAIILLLNLINSFNSVKCINCNGNGSTISGTCVYCKGSGKISKSDNKRLFGIEEMP